MSHNRNKYKATLSIILYELNYNRNKNIKLWGKHQEDYFLKFYGLSKINYIGDCIKHYFKYRDLDLDTILPSMNATKEEKECFLKFILDGFIKSGFIPDYK